MAAHAQETTIPRENDVLLGRGHFTTNHPGNRRYRALVDSRKLDFARAKKGEKKKIAKAVLDEILGSDPPARFLAEVPGGVGDASVEATNVQAVVLQKLWTCVMRDKALAKVAHRLRQLLNPPKGGDAKSGPTSNGVPPAKELTSTSSKNICEGGQHICADNVLDGSPKSKSLDFEPLDASIRQDSAEPLQEPGDWSLTDLDLDEEFNAFLNGLDTQQDQNDFSSTSNIDETAQFGVDHAGISDHNAEAQASSNGMRGNFSEEEVNAPLLKSQPDEEEESTHELSLKEWIAKSKAKLKQSPDQFTSYLKSAVAIALKLTEFLIEAEKERHSFSPACFSVESILIRSKELRLVGAEEVGEIIEFAFMMSLGNDSVNDGGLVRHLFALGVILYQLFAGEDSLTGQDLPSFDESSSLLSMNQMDLKLTGKSDDASRPWKRSHGPASQPKDGMSDCILRLESTGVPFSLCALVKNLLSSGDLCSEDAYTSFADLRLDLQLMTDDPSRFLYNIQTQPTPVLEVCGKLYGRDNEMAKLEQAYQQHLCGECIGIVIAGKAGVGKSKLAGLSIRKFMDESNGYTLLSKFDQNRDVEPLGLVGGMFNQLCDLFARDARSHQLKSVQEALERGLGSQAGLLFGVVPSLRKLMPSCVGLESSVSSTNSAFSMRYLLSELLMAISSHSRPISIFFDDVQFADSASLLLLGNFLFSIDSSKKKVFFAFCYRDNEVDENHSPFEAWLNSLAMFSFCRIKLEDITIDDANRLVSDSLGLSPRITRPLASVLHRKTAGNPFFLRQLMESLFDQKILSFQMYPPRWIWDMNAIMEMELSTDVLALLTKDMHRLNTDLQLGLKVASCMGSCVSRSVLGILSKDLKVDLKAILEQICKRGFVDSIDGDFKFAHDRIQEAAYGLMSERDRREYHMRFGLCLCSHVLNERTENDQLFFTAVNQVNHSGPSVINDPGRQNMIAALNLKAGRRAMVLSDYSTSLKMFQHGVSFLAEGHWNDNYALSVDLFNAAVEAACYCNNNSTVTSFSDRLLAHAKSYDDKLNCLWIMTKVLRRARQLKESMEASINILLHLGEKPLRPLGDVSLTSDMKCLNTLLRGTSDAAILGMDKATGIKFVTTLKLYGDLSEVLLLTQPSLTGEVAMRMVSLTVKTGLTSVAPVAFAIYGQVLTGIGNLSEGCRMGRLALKLCSKEPIFTSAVIATAYQTVLWASEPLQSIVDAHLIGQRHGLQGGQSFYARLNWFMSIMTDYLAGQNLVTVQQNITLFIRKMQNQNDLAYINSAYMLHSQITTLQEGLETLEMGRVEDDIPTEKELFAKAEIYKNKNDLLLRKIHQLVRDFLFQRVYDMLPNTNISDIVFEQKTLLRPMLIIGLFFEGLASYQLARETKETPKWIARGDAILVRMKRWSDHSAWTWENKMLLLEAEKMRTSGDFDRAALLYKDAIRSSKEHKLMHEEAIASELGGLFFWERGALETASKLLTHSICIYQKWGAHAIARRVEKFLSNKYGPDFSHVEQCAGESVLPTLECHPSNKRRERE